MTTFCQGTRPSPPRQAPFVQIPGDLLALPSDELHVYLVLLDLAGGRRDCRPTDREIGRRVGRSQGTVSRLVGRLEGRGLVRRRAEPKTGANPSGRALSPLRRVAPPQRQGCPATEATVAPAAGQSEEYIRDPYRPDAPRDGARAGGGTDPGSAWESADEARRAAARDYAWTANPGLRRYPAVLDRLAREHLAAGPQVRTAAEPTKSKAGPPPSGEPGLTPSIRGAGTCQSQPVGPRQLRSLAP